MKKTKLTIRIISKEKKHADRQIKPLKNGSNTALISDFETFKKMSKVLSTTLHKN